MTDTATEMLEKALAADRRRREPLVAEAKSLGDRHDDLMLKWHLSLAVGNGAGGIGLTSAIVNTWTKTIPQFPFVAGLWCFAVGLLAAGLIPLLRALRIDRDRSQKLVSAYSFPHGGKSYVYVDENEMEESDTSWDRHGRIGRWWSRAAIGAQILSAAGFAAGVLVPLIWLTIHLR
ncbi:hypothetical protein [Caulobacter sp.]|uniref:hypothetical protein n=1 Tax=Caulobacter sp. TaxID=78 RepID=UPI003BAEB38E